jgi:hypothetical protein
MTINRGEYFTKRPINGIIEMRTIAEMNCYPCPDGVKRRFARASPA